MPTLPYHLYLSQKVLDHGKCLTRSERRTLKYYLCDRNPVAYNITFVGWSDRNLALAVDKEAAEEYAEIWEDEDALEA